jgi:hypothetical protein
MVEPEPHIRSVIADVPAYELPQLAAQLLQRVCFLEGSAHTINLVKKYWHDPVQHWEPWA